MTGHLNSLNKELKGKDKLITEMFESIKAFRIKLQLWENQLYWVPLFTFFNINPWKLFFFCDLIQEYARRIFLLRQVLNEWFKVFTNMELEFIMSALSLKIDTEKAPENLHRLSAFYGTWRFFILFTRARHWSLTWAKTELLLLVKQTGKYQRKYLFKRNVDPNLPWTTVFQSVKINTRFCLLNMSN